MPLCGLFSACFLLKNYVKIGMGVATIFHRKQTAPEKQTGPASEGEKVMLNYVYGAATTIALITAVDVIDTNIPNSLGYYVGLIVPF